MKATELLQKQHRDIEALLNKLRAAGQGDETEIKNELAAVLVAHTTIEKESFYPAMEAALPEEILEAKEEHGLADVQLARLLSSPSSEETEARVSVLSDVVLRHIRREETDIFKVADREMGEEAMTGIADTMARRFRQLVDGDYNKMLQKALDQEVPRIAASSRRAAKKTTRRAAAGKKAKTGRRAAAAAPQRTPTRRAPTKRGQSASSRKGKSTRAGAGGSSRTRGSSGGASRASSGGASRSRA